MSEFVKYLLELLAPLTGVRERKMFGGYGLFKEDLMFGLVSDVTLQSRIQPWAKISFLLPPSFNLLLQAKPDSDPRWVKQRTWGVRGQVPCSGGEARSPLSGR